MPRDRRSGKGKGRGFGFVCFKTEWDANQAIQQLDGRLIHGRRIGVQKAKVLDRSAKKYGQNIQDSGRLKKSSTDTQIIGRGGLIVHPVKEYVEKQRNEQVLKTREINGVPRRLLIHGN